MMIRIKFILSFVFLIIVLSLTGCVTPPDQQLAKSPLPTNTIPPEPTNTPLPPTETMAIGDPCSVAGQQQQIDAAFADYQAARVTDGDAVGELTDWVGGVTTSIAINCNPATTVTSDPQALADLLDKLKSGGYVIYVRHTHTDRSRGDEDVSLGMCDKQRILSDQGRAEALLIGNAYQQLDLPVSQLISTQYCRTLETAVLAFGVPQVVSRTDLHAALPTLLATEPDTDTNNIIVAHIGTIRDRVGLDDTFEEGDSLVYRPTGNGRFEYVGRIGLYDWPTLATIKVASRGR